MRRTATADSRNAARLRGAELELELGTRKQAAETVTVGELLDMHLEQADWSPTTLHDSRHVATHLPDAFRARMVDSVTAPHIAGLYRELTRTGWSAHRIRRVRLVLSTAWPLAIEHGWATVNPVRDVKMPKLPHRDITPPDEATVDKILANATGTFEIFLRLAAATGARRGELIGLQWGDIQMDAAPGVLPSRSARRRRTGDQPSQRIDTLSRPDAVMNLTHALVRIHRSLVCTVDGIAPRDTKTGVKGHRTIKLGETLTERLRQHYTAQTALNADAVWVFSHTAGHTPWRPDYTSREFARVCRKAGVAGVRLHDLRHYLATSMLAEGDSPHAVATRLGHSSTSTTLRTYSHWIEEDDVVADRMDRRHG